MYAGGHRSCTSFPLTFVEQTMYRDTWHCLVRIQSRPLELCEVDREMGLWEWSCNVNNEVEEGGR